MIQQRRRSRHMNGSTKSNKTFDKHNGIKRIKDEDEKIDWEKIIDDSLESVNLPELFNQTKEK